MAQSRQNSAKVAALNQEIADLRAEVAAQKKTIGNLEQTDQPKRRRWRWQTVVAWLSLALATALLVVGNLFFWAGNTIVDTNRYVATVGPLITKPPIQSAIAQYTTTQIFNNVDVQGYVQSALPPRAVFLAPQLTSSLKSQTQSTLKSIIASPKAQSYWYSSLTRRHQALIKFSKSYQGNGTIDVSDIYSQLSQRLATTKLSFLANKQLPSKVGSIKVTTVGWLPALHKLSNNIGLYQALATLLVVVFSGIAIWLSRRRRKMVITLSLFFAAAMLVTLLAVRIGGSIAVSKVAPAYQSAAQVAYDTVLHSFRVQTASLLLAGLLVGLIAWLSGPYRSARFFKNRLTAFLSGRLHQAVFGNKENGFTRWVGKYKRYLEWGSVLVVALVMLLVRLSPRLIVVYGLLILVWVLVIEFLAAPEQRP